MLPSFLEYRTMQGCPVSKKGVKFLLFILNEDKSIYITRGDIAFFAVQITVEGTDELYRFQPGEVVRFKVFDKKGCDCVAMQKDFPIVQETDTVKIFLGEADTKIGGVISKPKDYWYEVELNPHTNPQTVVAYDEEGPRVFKLFPEGKDVDVSEGYTPEVIPVIDTLLDATSLRPVANQPVALAIMRIGATLEKMERRKELRFTMEDGTVHSFKVVIADD